MDFKISKKKQVSYLAWFLLVVMVAIGFHRMSDFTGIRNVTADGIEYSILQFNDIRAENPLDLAVQSAKLQGRLQHVLNGLVEGFVSTVADQWLYDLLNVGFFLLSVTLVAAILGKVASQWIAVLFVVLFFSLIPQIWEHTTPAAYPVWPWLPVIFFSLSFFLYRHYFTTGYPGYFVVAALFFFISLFSGELFVLVFPACAIVLLYLINREYAATKNLMRNSIAVALALSAIYVAIYIGFRMLAGGSYDGAEVGTPSLVAVLRTVFQFSVGGFIFLYVWRGSYPIYYLDSLDSLKISLISPFSIVDILMHADLLDIVVAGASGVLAAFAISKASNFLSIKKLLYIVLFGTVIAFLSLVLFGLTGKYTAWAEKGISAYYCTRYAYFAWIIVISALFVAGYRVTKTRNARFGQLVLAGLSATVVLGSLSASYFNGQVAASMRVHTAKWEAVDVAMQCGPFERALGSRSLFAPRLDSFAWWASIRNKQDYWTLYARDRFGAVNEIMMEVDQEPNGEFLFFDYRMSTDGVLFGAFAAERDDDDRTNELLVISDRRSAVQVLYEDSGGQRATVLSWGMKSQACGKYMLNKIAGNAIDVRSIVMFRPSEIPLINPVAYR